MGSEMAKKIFNLGSAESLNHIKRFNKNLSKRRTTITPFTLKWFVEFDKKTLYKFFYMSPDNNLLIENTI